MTHHQMSGTTFPSPPSPPKLTHHLLYLGTDPAPSAPSHSAGQVLFSVLLWIQAKIRKQNTFKSLWHSVQLLNALMTVYGVTIHVLSQPVCQEGKYKGLVQQTFRYLQYIHVRLAAYITLITYLGNKTDVYAAVIFTLHSEMEELTERFNERHALYVTNSTSKLSKKKKRVHSI